ncbi:anthrone oxygenase family protein [Haloactinopolyspora alba]|uniref:anthrone oxygenase family protein n=1 Tax=Haloactinopolyspora alba TaxID=648780 RepID=UPI0013EA5EB7|nr:anthrone oxygenase family protein [Haloactinopolyspora alba]
MAATTVAAAVAIATAWTWGQGSPWLRLSGGTLFVLGNFLLTAAYIDPRSRRLADSETFWPTVLDEWVPANHVRALACTASCILLVVASSPRRRSHSPRNGLAVARA